MALTCDQCFLSFPTNTKLYTHKKVAHSSPKLVLLNHKHGASPPPPPPPKKSKQDDGRHDDNDGDDGDGENGGVYPRKKRKTNPASDDGLRIVDEVNDNDSGDDGHHDPNLDVVDDFRAKDYRALYKDCLKKGRNMQVNYSRKLEALKDEYKTELKEKLEDQQRKFDSRLAELKQLSEKKLSDLEDLKDHLCAEEKKRLHEDLEECKNECNKLKSSVKGCNDEIASLRSQHQQEIEDMERQCEEKIKMLQQHIDSLEDDDMDISPLIKAIFNCTTMEEIYKIQNLIENHQMDQVIENHLPTLQNLFLSLSYGILPVCQPQRKKVSKAQRALVKKIQTGSKARAKKLLNENRTEITNFFSIVKDSIKLARNSFNRFS